MEENKERDQLGTMIRRSMAKVREFFKVIFDGMSESHVRLDDVCFNSISDEDNALLFEVVSDEKVKDIVWSCDSSKSPGLDGFNFSFIKFCWECLKDDFISAVKDFLVNEKWPTGSNVSFTCQIPKTNNPQQLRDFGPISLVGCVYKIISKILAIRLKKMINKVIDARQSSFLEGSGLMDGVLVANEVLDEMKRKKKSCVFFKVDYEKANDFVMRDFIYYMLGRFGFCEKWISWIKACFESALVSVLINGIPSKEFIPKKGLRQWDPLAPFLFLIVIEGLVGVSRTAIEKELVESLEIDKN